MWKSVDCCTPDTTWTPVNDDPTLANIAIGDIVIDPTDHNTVYAGTGDLRFGSFSFGSTGLLKSTDQGESWTLLGTDVFAMPYPEPAGEYPQYQAIGKVRVDPNNGDTVAVGTKTGVFFSYDGGESWSDACLTNEFDEQRQDVTGMIVRDMGDTTELYVAIGTRGTRTEVQFDLDQNGANGIYKTTMPSSGCPDVADWELLTRDDNGWPAGTGEGTPGAQGGNIVGRIDVAMAPSNPDVIYAEVQAVTGNVHGLLGLWRTTDGGVTWEQRATASDLDGCGFDYPQNWYDQGLAVLPNDPDTLYMHTYDVWRSSNGGTDLTDITCGYSGGDEVHVDQHALEFVPGDPSKLLVGNDGGIYLFENADTPSPTFHQLNTTVSTIEFYSGDITANFATADAPGINAGAQDNGSSVYVWDGEEPGPRSGSCARAAMGCTPASSRSTRKTGTRKARTAAWRSRRLAPTATCSPSPAAGRAM